MADIDKIEKRLIKLETRYERFVDDTNRMAQNIANVVEAIQKKIEKNTRAQNVVNSKTYKYVTNMEKQFAKLDKSAKKMKKFSDPRSMERNTMRLVDQALKIYDQKKGRR